MSNPFWVAFRLTGKSGVEVASDADISRATFYNTINEDGIPDEVRYRTMRLIAQALGKRLVITLEPVDNGSGAK